MSKTIYLKPEQLQEVNHNTYMIWVFMDLAEKCITNIDGICRDKDINRQLLKQKLDLMKKTVFVFRDKINEVHKDQPDKIIQFGEIADLIEIQTKTDIFYALKKELNL